MKENNDNTNIFVIGHKDFKVPDIDGYKKILVGANNNRRKVKGKFDFYDNINDNISDKNQNYCELTAVYWIWKNINNIKNVGICHYRRFFSKKKIDSDSKYYITPDIVEKILEDYDIILAEKSFVGKDTKNVYTKFLKNSVKEEDIKNMTAVVKKLYPEYSQILDDILLEDKISFANMMVTSKDIYDNYCKWLFDILFEVEKITNYSNRTSQQMRVYGYLSEILLNVWVRKNNLRVRYENVIKSDQKHNWKYYVKFILEKMKLY